MWNNYYARTFFILLCGLLSGAKSYSQKGTAGNLNFLKDYRVVLLGEPTHGEGNVFAWKTDLVQYLHDSLGFNVVAFESGFYDLYHAQQLINNNNAINAGPLLRNSLFPIWTQAVSFQPFLDYYDTHKGNMHIAGFDCQLTGIYSQRELLPAVAGLLQQYQPASLAGIDTVMLQRCIESFAVDFSFPADVDYNRFKVQVDRLLRSLSAIKVKDERVKWYVQAIRNVGLLGADYNAKKERVLDEETFKAKDSNLRDSMMAQNLLTLLQLYPGERIVCWGAGTHFMNDPSGIRNEELQAYKPMGMYLKNALGADQVFNLTFISSSGNYGLVGDVVKQVPWPEAGSIEEQLSRIGKDTLVLLRHAPFNREAVAYCLEYTPVRADWSKLFDAFVYLSSFCAPEGIPAMADSGSADTQEGSRPIVVDKRNTVMGIVTDAITKQPLSSVNVLVPGLPYELMTNDSGQFFLPQSNLNTALTLHCLGYSPSQATVRSGERNVFALLPQRNKLEEVTIAAGKIDIPGIIRNVKKHWKDNYETEPYAQQGYNTLHIANFDTTVLDMELVSDYYAFIRNSYNTRNIDCKALKINYQSDRQRSDRLYGAGSFPLMGAAVEPSEIFRGNPLRHFDFRLKSIQDDSISGTVFVIGYAQRKMDRWLTDTWLIKSNEGEIWVKESDYAVLKVQSTIRRDTATFNRWARKYQHKQVKVAGRKIDYDDKIMEYEQNETSSSYVFDPASGKYYLAYHKDTWQRRGYFLNTQQRFDTRSVNTFYTLGNIRRVTDKAALPYSSFRLFNQQEYDAGYWNSFVRPRNMPVTH